MANFRENRGFGQAANNQYARTHAHDLVTELYHTRQMVWRLIISFCLVTELPAADRWLKFQYGPFEVLTDAGQREGRNALNQLEQLRYTLGGIVGRNDLQTVWPVRVLVFRSPGDFVERSLPSGLGLGRDAFMGASVAKQALPASLKWACVQALISSSFGPLPHDLELGLATVFSTLDVTGTRVVLGKPPSEAERDLDWAMAHMVVLTPDYYGKLKILMHNLQSGIGEEIAYRNAFGKTPDAIRKEAQTYLRAGTFSTTTLSGRPLNPDRDFPEQIPPPGDVQVAKADLYLANPARTNLARSAYTDVANASLEPAQAQEGLGLLALKTGEKEDARKLLAAAIKAGTTSARAFFEYALVEADAEKAANALDRAAKLNPRWAAPLFELGLRETDLRKRVELLSAAAKLDPRNDACWQKLAETHTSLNQLVEASRAWAAAERAAPNEQERRRLGEIRTSAEKARLEKEEADRRRRSEQERLALEKLKRQAEASIQAALEKANRDSTPRKPGEKVYEWWEDPKPPASVEGTLQQVECLAKRTVFVVLSTDRRRVRLLVEDPRQLVVRGGGEFLFACGPQRSPRKVRIGYFPKTDNTVKSAGEAATIEFLN